MDHEKASFDIWAHYVWFSRCVEPCELLGLKEGKKPPRGFLTLPRIQIFCWGAGWQTFIQSSSRNVSVSNDNVNPCLTYVFFMPEASWVRRKRTLFKSKTP